MRSRQLSDLQNDVLFLLDLQNAQTPATSDLTNVINQGISELFSILMRTNENAYFRKSVQFTTNATQSIYSLPPDFYELLSLEIFVGTNDSIILTQFTNTERPYLASTTPGWSGEPLKYMVQGKSSYTDYGSIELLPVPSSNLTCTLYYVWAPTRLVNATDTFDGVAGFEDYAVLFAVYRCALKYRQFEMADRMVGEMARQRDQTISMAKGRDAFMPPHIQQVRHLWKPRYNRRGW